MNHKVLFVDDEANILSTIRRTFRSSDYECFFSESPEEALDLIKENKMSVIISDMRMPGMNGAQFLEKSAEIAPDSVRMILSGFSEKDSVMKAINQGHVWSFLTKPWENEELRLSVKNAISVHEDSLLKKKLANELEEKNIALSEMNHKLEEKVKERTEELEARSDILELILNKNNTSLIMSKIETQLLKMNGMKEPKIVIGKDIKTGDFPIQKAGVLLGSLQHNMSEDKLLMSSKKIESLLSLAAISISLDNVIEDSQGILSDIDLLMNEE